MDQLTHKCIYTIHTDTFFNLTKETSLKKSSCNILYTIPVYKLNREYLLCHSVLIRKCYYKCNASGSAEGAKFNQRLKFYYEKRTAWTKQWCTCIKLKISFIKRKLLTAFTLYTIVTIMTTRAYARHKPGRSVMAY